MPGGGGGYGGYIENSFDPVLKQIFKNFDPVLEKSRIYGFKDMHEVTVFFQQESTDDKFDLFWKIIGFEAMAVLEFLPQLFTEIVNPVLEFKLKIETLKACTFRIVRYGSDLPCPTSPPPPSPQRYLTTFGSQIE